VSYIEGHAAAESAEAASAMTGYVVWLLLLPCPRLELCRVPALYNNWSVIICSSMDPAAGPCMSLRHGIFLACPLGEATPCLWTCRSLTDVGHSARAGSSGRALWPGRPIRSEKINSSNNLTPSISVLGSVLIYYF